MAALRAFEEREAYPVDDEPYDDDMLTEEQIEYLQREKEELAMWQEIQAEEALNVARDTSFGQTPEEIQRMLDDGIEIEKMLSEERYANME